MKFDLTPKEMKLLADKGISFNADHEYTDDEAIDILRMVRDVEESYAQFTGGREEEQYFAYGNLADKIHSQIPEE